MFQSSPNPKVGRYAHDAVIFGRLIAVSILAQPEGRALLQRPCLAVATGRFNPRPTRRSGATSKSCGFWHPFSRFQSSPNPKVGRYIHPLFQPFTEPTFQSSPNPKVGRYLLYARKPSTRERTFQSSPNPKVGRYLPDADGQARLFDVSILAQPEGRALLVTPKIQARVQGVSILAQPEGRALRDQDKYHVRRVGFQSSPNPKVGRYLAPLLGLHTALRRFNPRPTRRSGATPASTGIPLREFEFQSSPNPKVGRYQIVLVMTTSLSTFQSSPNPKVGRYGELGDLRDHLGVSILAQPEGRALPASACCTPRRRTGFNPRPTRRSGATADGHDAVPGLRAVSILAQPEGRALLDNILTRVLGG